jgi:hypothetical protein
MMMNVQANMMGHPGMSPMGMIPGFPMQGPPPLVPNGNAPNAAPPLSPNTGMAPFPGFFHPSNMEYPPGGGAYVLSPVPTNGGNNSNDGVRRLL